MMFCLRKKGAKSNSLRDPSGPEAVLGQIYTRQGSNRSSKCVLRCRRCVECCNPQPPSRCAGDPMGVALADKVKTLICKPAEGGREHPAGAPRAPATQRKEPPKIIVRTRPVPESRWRPATDTLDARESDLHRRRRARGCFEPAGAEASGEAPTPPGGEGTTSPGSSLHDAPPSPASPIAAIKLPDRFTNVTIARVEAPTCDDLEKFSRLNGLLARSKKAEYHMTFSVRVTYQHGRYLETCQRPPAGEAGEWARTANRKRAARRSQSPQTVLHGHSARSSVDASHASSSCSSDHSGSQEGDPWEGRGAPGRCTAKGGSKSSRGDPRNVLSRLNTFLQSCITSPEVLDEPNFLNYA